MDVREERTEPVVYIVDDDAGVRDSLSFLVESVGHQVNLCASSEEFLEKLDGERNACVILDLRLPGMDGLELLVQLGRRGVRIPVILLTAYADVGIAVRAMKAGAFDLFEKPCNDHSLLECIHRALERDRQVKRQQAIRDDIKERFDRLTPRELEVLKHIVAGRATRRIAEVLNVSKKTIEAHRSNLMHKLDAESVVGLVRMYCMLYGDGPHGTDRPRLN